MKWCNRRAGIRVWTGVLGMLLWHGRSFPGFAEDGGAPQLNTGYGMGVNVCGISVSHDHSGTGFILWRNGPQ